MGNLQFIGDTVSIEVLHKDKKEIRTAEIIDYENEKITGISVVTNYNIKTHVNIKGTGQEKSVS